MAAPRLAHRLPVWTALAELFLDTAPDEASLDRIAETLHRAGLDAASARAVLRTELAPVFYTNLLSPAGAWTAWSEAEVGRLMQAHRARSRLARAVAAWQARAARPLYEDQWPAIAARLAALAASPPLR